MAAATIVAITSACGAVITCANMSANGASSSYLGIDADYRASKLVDPEVFVQHLTCPTEEMKRDSWNSSVDQDI